MATQLNSTDEDKRKHLEFVQLVITRMNVNSFLVKGWTVTLVAGLFALAAKDANVDCILITYVSVPLFWLLDGYYLGLERQYRSLYNVVRKKNSDEIDYDLNATIFDVGKNMWLPSTFSVTLLVFHGTLLVATSIVMQIIK